jgi:hypothetical protein
VDVLFQEEYRMQKLQESAPVSRANGDDEKRDPRTSSDDKDDSSIRTIHSVEPASILGKTGGASNEQDTAAEESPSIPTIKISTDSDHEREQLQAAEAGGMAAPNGTMDGPAPGVEKPHAAAHDGAKDGLGITEGPPVDGETPASPKAEEEKPSGSSFQNKRLCERWLDNLFMVLYEVRGG